MAKRVLVTGNIGLAGARPIAAEGGGVAVTGVSAERLAEAARLPAGSLVLRNDATGGTWGIFLIVDRAH